MADRPRQTDSELDPWLAELGGESGTEKTATSGLRQMLLDEQQRHESEFDEMRQRRLRSRIQDKLATAQTANAKPLQRWSRPMTLAASVFVIFTVGLFANQLRLAPGEIDEPAWVYSYGDLQRTRGEANVRRALVEQPSAVARKLGKDLAEARVAFQMTARDDGTFRLEIRVADTESLGRANIALRPLGISLDAPGFFIVIVL